MTFDVAAALTTLGQAGQLVLLLVVGVPLVVIAAFRSSQEARNVGSPAVIETAENLRLDR
jgi:hypothetical protein